MEREGLYGRLRWRWQRSETRHRLTRRSGLHRMAAGSGSTLLRRWAEREDVIFQYVFLRRLAERRRLAKIDTFARLYGGRVQRTEVRNVRAEGDVNVSMEQR